MMNQEAPSVLLVEDELLIAFALEEELTEAGFQVTSLTRPSPALSAIEGGTLSYRALVTDIDLGEGLDGWALARRAREVDSQLAVIYMSGKSGVEWAAQGVPNSVMLQKPFAFSQLLTALSAKLNEQPPR